MKLYVQMAVPQVQIQSGSQPNHIQVIWKNLHIHYVNAIRRTILVDIPTMAIEYVYIKNNTSYTADEFLVHRLGFIPIRANAYVFQLPSLPSSPSSSQHPPQHQHQSPPPPDADTLRHDTHLLFSIQATGKRTIYASDMEWIPLNASQKRMKPRPEPVHPDIPLICLPESKQLDIRCVAVRGTGRKHIKWSAVEHVFHYYSEDENDIVMEIESKGIYSCHELLIKALNHLRDQFNRLSLELNIPFDK